MVLEHAWIEEHVDDNGLTVDGAYDVSASKGVGNVVFAAGSTTQMTIMRNFSNSQS